MMDIDIIFCDFWRDCLHGLDCKRALRPDIV